MLDLIIVDDEKLIREGLVSYIDWASLGIRVAGVCATGPEALDRVREAGADLVLTDIRMPGMDGIELLKRLRGINPRCEVIFVSAYRNFEYARKALRYGAFDYVMKPIEEAALYETFRRCVKHIADGVEGEPAAVSAQDAASEELRLYLQAGMRDPEIWRRLEAALRIPAGGARRLVIVRRTGTGTDAAAGEETDALRQALQVDGSLVFSLRLDEIERVLLAFEDPRRAASRPSTEFADRLATLATVIVGSSGGPYDADPTALYNEAAWALLALSVNPIGRSMAYAQFRTVLAKRPPQAATPALLAELIMGTAEPDPEGLAWSLFAGMIRGGLAPEPGVVRLEVSRAVESAVGILAGYPTLRPGVAAMEGLGQLVARERGVLAIYTVTRMYLEKLRAIVRERLSSGISRRINEAINMVRDDPASDVSLAGVARRLLVSPGYLSREFSREMAESFSHFRSRMRVERAKQLLLDHRHKVYEVAALVGFTDVAQFTKVFNRLAGMPPSEYRRQGDGRTGSAPG